ncbi:MAG: DNA primase [Candidatus Diapherotrites archaeon]|uniref:DNA primase DnaG n=1 Tax=Candidatus Iainarchaeum sp. TaxID=3101447 RepID=A0A8T4L7C9_9ARCH|nr:DNA primase [Candidatus Diapherotrites archaeon]
MAKTYVNTVKYMIHIKFEVKGIVDKPDIVGAIFGQSEGLLGDEMDLKELQKNGKVGRIEIEHKSALGKTKGMIYVPSSMDMVETSILAAAVESVDKVGPCEAKFEVAKIEDTRGNKREEIKNRAKELLKNLMDTQAPETTEIKTEVQEQARAADIETYGGDKLPCGPDAKTDPEIVVVEGRADVVNLLKNNIKNVVGMEGSKISQDIVDLCRDKQVTVFVDGDRGGDLIARKLMQLAKVDFVAKAPDGKEVEELQRKEIIMALRKRMTLEEFDNAQAFRPREERPFNRPEGERREFGGHGERTGFDRGFGRGRGFGERSEGFGGRGQGFARGPPGGERGYGPRPGFRERSPRGRFERGQFEGNQSAGSPSEGGEGEGQGFETREGRGQGFGERRQSGFGRGRGRFERGGPRRGGSGRMGFHGRDRPGYGEEPAFQEGTGGPAPLGERKPFSSFEAPAFAGEEAKTEPTVVASAEERALFEPILKELRGTLKARLLDDGMNVLSEVEVKDLVQAIGCAGNAKTVVFDGIITKRLADEADKAGVQTLVGVRKGKLGEGLKVKALAL